MADSSIASLAWFPKQMDFIRSTDAHVAAITGVGGGKTRSGAGKTLAYVLQHPGAWGMVTAPTYRMLADATLQAMREITPESLYDFTAADMTMRFKNGSVILFRSTDNPESLRGPNLSFVWMDEAALSSEVAFEILQGRLRQPGYPHQLWITTTPKGFNWVYQRFGAKEKPGYRLMHWTSRDNPFLTPVFVQTLEESYRDVFALQEVDGQFVLVDGTAYFDGASLASMMEDCCDPVTTIAGHTSIWKPPSKNGRYVAGADVAWGESKTSAFSCCVVLDFATGEQVAEVHGRLPAPEYSQAVIDVCTKYNNAYLVAEANAEGRHVIDQLVALGYGPRMYHRDVTPGDAASPVIAQKMRLPRKPGWLTDITTRPVMLGELADAVLERQIRPHSKPLVEEMMAFIRNENGRPEASERAYADRVMATAMAWQARKYARFPSPLHRGQDGRLTRAVYAPKAF